MEVVSNVLVLLLAVVVSTFVIRLLPPKIPAPLIQIAIGAALYHSGFEMAFDSHLFLLLFIPPLLFLDGWRIPKGAIFQDWKPILALAIGLVVLTVRGVGLFIHWLIPSIPLAVAFALAAILSPTDPVAVAAMTARSPLPSRLTHILEGESLLNDATGLVCFRFAVAAALTGTFSLASASLSFLLVAGGGVIVGLVSTALIGRLNRLLVARVGEDPTSQILISLLIPFAAYLGAESLHCSGILAAAVGGIAMHYTDLAGRPLAVTRMQRTVVWNTIQAVLNGIIFVLLGEHFPHFLRDLLATQTTGGLDSLGRFLGYALAITMSLVALRFFWVWVALRVTILRATRRGERKAMPRTRLIAVTATAGVRGAITLAGILTLPVVTADGSPFPARSTVITLAMAVILFSLLLAAFALPLLTKDLTAALPVAARRTGEQSARVAAAEAALRRLEALVAEPADPATSDARAKAALHLLEDYRRRLDYGELGEDADEVHRVADAEKELRLEALRAERDELFRLLHARGIEENVHQRLLRELDLVESSLHHSPSMH